MHEWTWVDGWTGTHPGGAGHAVKPVVTFSFPQCCSGGQAAYRLDPRVVARKEAQRAEREAKKAEKEAVRRRAAEEEAGKAAEAAAAKQAAAEAERAAAEEAKRQREADKKAIRKQRQRLRALCEPLLASAQKAAAAPSPSGNGAANGDATSGGALVVDADSVQKLCDRLEHEALSRLCDGMEAAPASCSGAEAAAAAQLQLLRGQLEALDERDAAEVAAKEGVKREAEAALKRAAQQERDARKAALREWGDEELRLLDKAVAKFPAGTQKRWEQVS